MKKICSFLMACVLMSSALTATAKREATTMTNRGPQLTSLSQLKAGMTVIFRAINRGGYLYEDDNKLWLGQGLSTSGMSAYYLFKVATFTNNGNDATITLTTPSNFNIPELLSGGQATIDANSVAAKFTLIPAKTEDASVGDSVWYIRDETNLYFNGNPLTPKSPRFGNYGPFVGWGSSGENSKYQIFLPETQTSTLYSVKVMGVGATDSKKSFYEPFTYEMKTGDSLQLPTVPNHRINLKKTTFNGKPVTISAGNYFKTKGDGTLSVAYELNDLLFTPIHGKDTTWHFLKVREKYYCYYNPEANNNTENGAIPTAETADENNLDAYLWAFAGDRENGFRIINKKAGNSLVLTAAGIGSGDANYLAPASPISKLNTYMYSEPVSGKFNLQLKDFENAYINQYGGPTGKLRFYVNGASKTDEGSLFIAVKHKDTVTGISATEVKAKTEASTIFDLSGRKVAKVQKGIYIINGKKTFVQ